MRRVTSSTAGALSLAGMLLAIGCGMARKPAGSLEDRRQSAGAVGRDVEHDAHGGEEIAGPGQFFAAGTTRPTDRMNESRKPPVTCGGSGSVVRRLQRDSRRTVAFAILEFHEHHWSGI